MPCVPVAGALVPGALVEFTGFGAGLCSEGTGKQPRLSKAAETVMIEEAIARMFSVLTSSERDP
jgi:hypothetical protein